MSFFSFSRSVLVLGDDGLQVFSVKKQSVKRLACLPWNTHEFEDALEQILVKKMGRAPVVVLNDMVEQHYRKEYLLKVSILEQASVLKRRLNLAFPNYPIRAALKLDNKKHSTGEKSGVPYLFAAIPASSAFLKTFSVIKSSQAPIVGLYLLPAEGAAMVKALSAKLAKNKTYKPVWTVFVGQHHGGGLRQIVTRNGDLALTRLTPIVDTDIEPDLWAKELSTELNATMSYLARFGYSEADGLQIIICAGSEATQALKNTIQVECDLTIMTSLELSKALGVSIAVKEDLRYADPLHAAYIGAKKSFSLPMQTPLINDLEQPRKVASFVLFGLLVGCSYLGFVSFQNFKKSINLQDQYIVAEQQSKALNEEYSFELEKKKALGFDFLQVNNALEIHSDFMNQKMAPLTIVQNIGGALGTDIHLDKLEMAVVQENSPDKTSFSYGEEEETQKDKHFLETIITISFPSSVSPDISVQRVNSIRDKLAETMQGYDVEVIKQIADLSYTGNFTGEASLSSSKTKPEKYEAEIKIRGAIK